MHELALESGSRYRRSQGDPLGERELVAAILRGDGVAFEIVMRRHNRLMFRTARAILDNEADAEDVVQDAYVKAYTRLDQFTGKARLSTWLCRIVVNEALGRLRRRMPHAQLDDFVEEGVTTRSMDTSSPLVAASLSPEEEAARGQLRALLERAIAALPRDQRAVFMLRAVEGFSIEETADCLAVPPETVKTRLHRARKRLQRDLGSRFEARLPEVFPFAGTRCDRVVAGVLRRFKDAAPPG